MSLSDFDGVIPECIDDRPGKVIAVITLNGIAGLEHKFKFLTEKQATTPVLHQ